jgi:hypothetical protein
MVDGIPAHWEHLTGLFMGHVDKWNIFKGLQPEEPSMPTPKAAVKRRPPSKGPPPSVERGPPSKGPPRAAPNGAGIFVLDEVLDNALALRANPLTVQTAHALAQRLRQRNEQAMTAGQPLRKSILCFKSETPACSLLKDSTQKGNKRRVRSLDEILRNYKANRLKERVLQQPERYGGPLQPVIDQLGRFVTLMSQEQPAVSGLFVHNDARTHAELMRLLQDDKHFLQSTQNVRGRP